MDSHPHLLSAGRIRWQTKLGNQVVQLIIRESESGSNITKSIFHRTNRTEHKSRLTSLEGRSLSNIVGSIRISKAPQLSLHASLGGALGGHGGASELMKRCWWPGLTFGRLKNPWPRSTMDWGQIWKVPQWFHYASLGGSFVTLVSAGNDERSAARFDPLSPEKSSTKANCTTILWSAMINAQFREEIFLEDIWLLIDI